MKMEPSDQKGNARVRLGELPSGLVSQGKELQFYCPLWVSLKSLAADTTQLVFKRSLSLRSGDWIRQGQKQNQGDHTND